MDDTIGHTECMVITAQEAGVRLDKILVGRYQELRSRTYFQRLIEEGWVRVNGTPVKKRVQPRLGDEVDITFLLTPEIDLVPEDIPLHILYEDEQILAVNKAPGMVVHPAPGNWKGTFVNALLHHCRELESTGEAWRPGIVHRLDKDTSGVLIAAKTSLAHQRLVECFSERKILKEYLAICVGNPGEGEVDAPIGRHPRQRKLMAVVEHNGRAALTRYRVLETQGNLSLVRLQLVTGRTHQARVHMRHRGTPVLGDMAYGHTSANNRYGVTRQMLHAERMQLLHPITGVPLLLEAPIPQDMKEFFF